MNKTTFCLVLFFSVMCVVVVRAQESSNIEIRAYRLYGTPTGKLWDKHIVSNQTGWVIPDYSSAERIVRPDPETIRWINFLEDTVNIGDFVVDGLSLHMEGETLEWIGESKSETPQVLKFKKSGACENKKPVTFVLDNPTLTYTHREDGAFDTKINSLGETFTITPFLRSNNENLIDSVRLFIEPSKFENINGYLNPEAASTPDTHNPTWTNAVLSLDFPNQWAGLLQSNQVKPGEQADAILIFIRAQGELSESETTAPPTRQYSLETRFIRFNVAKDMEEFIQEKLTERKDIDLEDSPFTAFSPRLDTERTIQEVSDEFFKLFENAGNSSYLFGAPRLTVSDRYSPDEQISRIKYVLRDNTSSMGREGSETLPVAPVSSQPGSLGSFDNFKEPELIELVRSFDETLSTEISRLSREGDKCGIIASYHSSPTMGLQLETAVLASAGASENAEVLHIDCMAVQGAQTINLPANHWWQRAQKISTPLLRVSAQLDYELGSGPIWFISSEQDGGIFVIQLTINEVTSPI